MTRRAILMITCAATITVALPIWLRPVPRLIWNASASVPIGLYTVEPERELRLDNLVVVSPPEPLASFLAERDYLPKGVPLLKHIAALPGQIVCRIDRTITVDGKALGEAFLRDRRGRALPVWHGCGAVQPGAVFLMNRQVEDSLDGRYFGVLPAAAIVGQAEPLWTKKEH